VAAPLHLDPPVLTSAADTALPEPFACQYCDAPAAAACPRCGALYCTDHGDAACDACSDPAGGLPHPWAAWLVGGGLIAGVVVALWLLIAPPRLPGEHPPAAVAATEGTPQAPARQQGGPAARPGSRSPGTAEAAPSPAGAPTAAPTAEKYTIKQGDTLGTIAEQAGTTVDALRTANPGIDERLLQIGQEIVIPPR
jgi:nucleoid-associated protein YgaU